MLVGDGSDWVVMGVVVLGISGEDESNFAGLLNVLFVLKLFRRTKVFGHFLLVFLSVAIS